MYYILFLRQSYNRFRCLGIYKDNLNVDNYPLFKDQKRNSTYSYIKLTEKELKKVKFVPGGLYIYDKGLKQIKEYGEKEVAYKPFIDDPDDLYLFDSQLFYNYQISIGFINILIRTLFDIRKRNLKEEPGDKSCALWYEAGEGCGKSYFLRAVSETAKRPTLIIDCTGIKPTSKRDLFNILLEKILDGFNDDREKVNNAIIMFDNFDKIDVPEDEIDSYIGSTPTSFAISEKRIESSKYGFDTLQMNNNIFIFTSTRKAREFTDPNIDMYPFYENVTVNNLDLYDLGRTKLEDFIVRYLEALRIEYAIKGIELEFKEMFIQGLVVRTYFLNKGYHGTIESLNLIRKMIDDEHYTKYTFKSYDEVIKENPSINVLSNVR